MFQSGAPQVVMPMAFDQFDNANRVAALECGSYLPMNRLSVDRLTDHLATLPQRSSRVHEIAHRIANAPDACEQAADACLACFDQRS